MSTLRMAELRERHLDALREVGNIGAGSAATALSTMMGRPIGLTVPSALILPLGDVAQHVGGEEAIVAAMYLRVTGDASGHILFIMPPGVAHAVTAVLTAGMPAGRSEANGFTEMELSALREVGNILTSSYLTALGELTGLVLEPSPPALGVDMAGALLGAVLAEVAMSDDVTLVIETAFERLDAPASGLFLFIPTSDALERVLTTLGVPA